MDTTFQRRRLEREKNPLVSSAIGLLTKRQHAGCVKCPQQQRRITSSQKPLVLLLVITGISYNVLKLSAVCTQAKEKRIGSLFCAPGLQGGQNRLETGVLWLVYHLETGVLWLVYHLETWAPWLVYHLETWAPCMVYDLGTEVLCMVYDLETGVLCMVYDLGEGSWQVSEGSLLGVKQAEVKVTWLSPEVGSEIGVVNNCQDVLMNMNGKRERETLAWTDRIAIPLFSPGKRREQHFILKRLLLFHLWRSLLHFFSPTYNLIWKINSSLAFLMGLMAEDAFSFFVSSQGCLLVTGYWYHECESIPFE